jgi:hypothetical protein
MNHLLKLSQNEKQSLLGEFPNIKLSYENMAYKKVYNSDFILGIPEGKKSFVWFTTYKDKPVCLLMELYENKQIRDIRVVNACFSERLTYGTIVYGTLFYHMNHPFFTIEDIFMNKGENVYRENWDVKINLIAHLLKDDLKQIAFNKYFIVFGLPIITKTHEEFDNQIKTSIPYLLASVQYRHSNRNNCYFYCSIQRYNEFSQGKAEASEYLYNHVKMNNDKNNNPSVLSENSREIKKSNVEEKQITVPFIKNVIFEIRPDVQNDIYHLYCDKNEYYGVASIPDYKTSVEMNHLFRKIKENNDLDALEESDDEEEFENSNEDKFVDLEKSVKMICKYHRRFKKWYPVKTAFNNQVPIDLLLARALVEKISKPNKKIYPVYTSI